MPPKLSHTRWQLEAIIWAVTFSTMLVIHERGATKRGLFIHASYIPIVLGWQVANASERTVAPLEAVLLIGAFFISIALGLLNTCFSTQPRTDARAWFVTRFSVLNAVLTGLFANLLFLEPSFFLVRFFLISVIALGPWFGVTLIASAVFDWGLSFVRRFPDGLECPGCGYDLRGGRAICPECGWSRRQWVDGRRANAENPLL